MFMQQSENIFAPVMGRSPTTASSISSWHPINASPSEDMWELPVSSSSISDDRDDYHTSGLHQEFTIYNDGDDFSTNTIQEHDTSMLTPQTVTVRAASNHGIRRHQESPSATRTTTGRGRYRGIGLSKEKCVLGDATNTLHRSTNASNTSRIQRSQFN